MKSILFVSPDLSLCASLLMFFYDKYTVTTTTNFENIQKFIEANYFDLLVIDAEPNAKIGSICREVRESSPTIPIILTYVYTKSFREQDTKIRKITDAVFYKPVDLEEVSQAIQKMLHNGKES